jgi:hypothetical protein
VDFKIEITAFPQSYDKKFITADANQALFHGKVEVLKYRDGYAIFDEAGQPDYQRVNALGRAISELPGVTGVTISRYRIQATYGRLFAHEPIVVQVENLITAYCVPS